ncbi:hypothetical protein K402DRAFT_451790 [Aulographum hederae CBS 113979]|uniref:Uncharacterized protein n=1 Tax=Aulographum hederae CBS 113979 TaxID=1176131 RepID=A0A6G1H9E6_9PEZI|nr:hypothetical protein K402DRAFT_451790 [Aulographum hederae CBS 113979]
MIPLDELVTCDLIPPLLLLWIVSLLWDSDMGPQPTTTLKSPSSSTHTLHVLLFTPTTTEHLTEAALLSRLHHFASLTGGHDIAIVFLLNQPAHNTATNGNRSNGDEHLSGGDGHLSNGNCNHAINTTAPSGIHAFTALSVLLSSMASATASASTSTTLPPIPLLPIPDPTFLPIIIQSFTSKLVSPFAATPASDQIPNAALDLLPYSTTEAPLPQDTLFALSDLFPDLREVVEGAGIGNDDGGIGDGNHNGNENVILRSLGREGAGVVDFWKGEWVAE